MNIRSVYCTNTVLYSYCIGGRLRLVMPLEGSATLRQWQQLATPDLSALLAATTISGVQMRSSAAVARAAALLEEEGEDDDLDDEDDDELADGDRSRTPTDVRGTTVTYSNSRIAAGRAAAATPSGLVGPHSSASASANAAVSSSPSSSPHTPRAVQRTPYPNMHLPRLKPRAPGPLELLLRAHGLGAASIEELAARRSGLLARPRGPEGTATATIGASGAVLGLNSVLFGGAAVGARGSPKAVAGVASATKPVPRHVITTTMGLNSVQLLGGRQEAASGARDAPTPTAAPESESECEPSASDPLVSSVLSAALTSVASARLDYRSLFSLLKRTLVLRPSASASSSNAELQDDATTASASATSVPPQQLDDPEDGRATPTPDTAAAALD